MVPLFWLLCPQLFMPPPIFVFCVSCAPRLTGLGTHNIVHGFRTNCMNQDLLFTCTWKELHVSHEIPSILFTFTSRVYAPPESLGHRSQNNGTARGTPHATHELMDQNSGPHGLGQLSSPTEMHQAGYRYSCTLYESPTSE